MSTNNEYVEIFVEGSDAESVQATFSRLENIAHAHQGAFLVGSNRQSQFPHSEGKVLGFPDALSEVFLSEARKVEADGESARVLLTRPSGGALANYFRI